MWTRIRAKELGLEEVHQGSVDKFPAYEEILRKKGLADAEVAVLGDDLMDVPLSYAQGCRQPSRMACRRSRRLWTI